MGSMLIPVFLAVTGFFGPPSASSATDRKWKPTIRVHTALPTSKKWTSEHAAHLLRRAGFGGTPEQIDFLTQMGRERAVEYLIDFEEIPEKPIPVVVEQQRLPERRGHGEADKEFQERLAQRMRSDQFQMQRILGWWIETMTVSPRPLQEKLVLFWHGHFTSGFREVKSSRAMYLQNQTFRKHAAGNFRDMLLAVTYDPAMILYLNTQQNRKGKPNENYARELMELFTLGTGHYTEKDIKEAARALTGIGVDIETGEGALHPRGHDDGAKTFLGRTGNLGPQDVVDIILQQPAAAEFLARKLWTFFAYDDPEEKYVRALAQVLRDSRYELKPALKAMFMCDAFYGGRARFTHVKSPAELLIGTLRMLEIAPEDTDMMNYAMRTMGQQLFQPPNVKGWDGGLTWITTSTLYNRYNLIGGLIDGNDNDQTRRRRTMMREQAQATFGKEARTMMAADEEPRLQPTFDPLPVVQRQELGTADQIVDYFVQRLLQRPIESERRQALLDAFEEQWKHARNEDAKAAAVRGLLKLIVSMPEYQLS